MSVPCVARMATTNYLLLSLVKFATEYLDAGVTAREKGGGGGGNGGGGVGGRPAGARDRGERTWRAGLGAGK